MGKTGKFDCKEFKEFQKQLEKLRNEQDRFVESCAKELAARLLRMVVKRTPVGDYSHEVEVIAKRDSKHHKKGDVYKKKVNTSGKVGGTLRRGWTIENVGHFGSMCVIEIVNPTEYASYVEYGHRTRDRKGWVKGKFMMTISERELEKIAPKVLENRIRKYLEGCLK